MTPLVCALTLAVAAEVDVPPSLDPAGWQRAWDDVRDALDDPALRNADLRWELTPTGPRLTLRVAGREARLEGVTPARLRADRRDQLYVLLALLPASGPSSHERLVDHLQPPPRPPAAPAAVAPTPPPPPLARHTPRALPVPTPPASAPPPVVPAPQRLPVPTPAPQLRPETVPAWETSVWAVWTQREREGGLAAQFVMGEPVAWGGRAMVTHAATGPFPTRADLLGVAEWAWAPGTRLGAVVGMTYQQQLAPVAGAHVAIEHGSAAWAARVELGAVVDGHQPVPRIQFGVGLTRRRA